MKRIKHIIKILCSNYNPKTNKIESNHNFIYYHELAHSKQPKEILIANTYFFILCYTYLSLANLLTNYNNYPLYSILMITPLFMFIFLETSAWIMAIYLYFKRDKRNSIKGANGEKGYEFR